MTESNRFRGCLLGLACGDAVGTTVEFKARGTFSPLTDMVGGGPFRLKPGEWTDDTSMALCLATSLAELGRFDAEDQAIRYCRWMDEGYLSSNSRCFDIGFTVREGLRRFNASGDPCSGSIHPDAAGNGSLMRLAPVPLFFYPDRHAVIEMSGQSSLTTHGAAECIDACRLFGAMLFQALAGADKEKILLGHGLKGLCSEALESIAQGRYRTKLRHEVQGSGYVVRCLEAALWCFWKTATFEDAILKAANLGDDADTTAAVCGQIAGAYYGLSGIPEKWWEHIVMKDEILALADRLHAHKPTRMMLA